MPGQISLKGTHALLRSDQDWPRVVATEIMQLSGGNVFVNLGFLKKTSKKQLIILTTKVHLPGKSEKYTRLMSHRKVTIALILEI